MEDLLCAALVGHEDRPELGGNLVEFRRECISGWEDYEMLECGVEVFLVVVVRTWFEFLFPFGLLFWIAAVQYCLFIGTRLDLLQNSRFLGLRLGRARALVVLGTSVKLQSFYFRKLKIL